MMRWTVFKVAIGVAVLSMAFLLTINLQILFSSPVDRMMAMSSASDEVRDETRFDDAWRDAAVPAALKSAVLFRVFRSLMADASTPSPPDASAGVLLVAKPSELSVSTDKPQRHAKNICERHGMKKRMKRNGGWRCR